MRQKQVFVPAVAARGIEECQGEETEKNQGRDSGAGQYKHLLLSHEFHSIGIS